MKIIVDFGDGKKAELETDGIVVHAGQCIRVRLTSDGHPVVTTEKYDELECTSSN